MKPTLKFLIATLMLIAVSGANAQEKSDFEKGERLFDKYEFNEALYYYELAYDQQPNNAALTRRIAETYRRVGQLNMSAEWYRKTLELASDEPKDMLYYAEALKSLEQYDEAVLWYERYKKERPNDKRADSHLQDVQYFRDLQADSLKYLMKRLMINNDDPAIGICKFEDGKFLLSAMRIEKQSVEEQAMWEEFPYLDIYSCNLDGDEELIQAEKLGPNVNSKYHDGPAYYCSADKTLYITRNNIKNGKAIHDRKGSVNLKIYSSTFSNDNWQPVQELKFNSDEYSNGHPCLSRDGQFIYFVSNRDGGFGGTDIYMCQRIPEGWTEPINLGPTVNTEGEEMFPYLSENNMLYFASNGWAGLGGLDIFVSEWAGDHWSASSNIGFPINSANDDFGILYDHSDNSGYFCSNRKGQGNDDVYYFSTLKLMKMILAGAIRSDVPGQTLAGERIIISSLKTGNVYEDHLDNDQEFTFEADAGDKVEVRIASDNYTLDQPVFSYETPIQITDPYQNLGVKYVTPSKMTTMKSALAGMMTEAEMKLAGQQSATGAFIPRKGADDDDELMDPNALNGGANNYDSSSMNGSSNVETTNSNSSAEQNGNANLSNDSANVAFDSATQTHDSSAAKNGAAENATTSDSSDTSANNSSAEKNKVDANAPGTSDASANNSSSENHEADAKAKSLDAANSYTQNSTSNPAQQGNSESGMLPSGHISTEEMNTMFNLDAMSLSNVQFDFDKAYLSAEAPPILDGIVKLMKEHAVLNLQISTFCDSRGSVVYNQSLSMSRAMAVKGYMMKKGINANRMKIEWHGEEKPLNNCVDEVPCTETEYEVNRRAEFKFFAESLTLIDK